MDSNRDHPTVVALLETYVRNHAPTIDGPVLPRHETLPDVRVAIAGLSELSVSKREGLRLQLRELDLRGLTVSSGDLRGSDLCYTALVGSSLVDCDLRDAVVSFAHAHECMFAGADLRRVSFYSTDLSRSFFARSDCRDASFDSARLVRADFGDRRESDGKIRVKAPNLDGASFHGADITGARTSAVPTFDAAMG
jgi:uncharacterized protein YjbI with pentapeptide repeats